ncbi:hypothetical protein FRC05_007332 [Tulasnella sp. 425]|nr:hypothetical protein FRC05_007332 [Tulasnella sp. 425]
MVSDFFHPVVGGVENHIYTLSAHLVKLGHTVVIISHSHHPDRTGIRHLAPGIKTYHIPFVPIASSATLPNFFTFLPYLRNILLRERIQLVHGHASLSSLAQEAILHAHLLGIKTVFTDHSLFGFDDAATILTNKLLVGALRNVDAVICVSNTGRENTVLRAHLSLRAESHIYVIPNAVIPEQFTPTTPFSPAGSEITIVVVSRLAYRKGMDLLVATAPRVCRMFPNVRFLIGGNGPKLVEILQMREKHNLQDQIALLGPVKHRDVHGVLAQGAIYLNTSLTESFGIGLLEAACAGLYVVSTRVGGVPEVLPENMVSFASPDEDDLLRALAEAINIVSSGKHNRWEAHARPRLKPDLDDFHNVYEYAEDELGRGRRSYVQPLFSAGELKELGVDKSTARSDEEAENERFDEVGNMDRAGVVDDEDDEELDSDEAFGESDDDEGLIQRHRNHDETEGYNSSADEGDVQALDDYIMDLPQKKRKVDEEADGPRQRRRVLPERTEIGLEGEFGGTGLPAKLRLEDLLSPETFPSDEIRFLKTLKLSAKALKSASGTSQPLATPLPLRLQSRVERQAAYRKTKDEVENRSISRFLSKRLPPQSAPLQENLLALSRRVLAPPSPHHALMYDTQPANDMESAVDRLLKRARLRDDIESRETELDAKIASIEEIRARQAELRRARESMSRAQVKAARMARIKSKMYRKIKRREKEKDVARAEDVAAIDPDLAAADRFQQDLDRARERATLRHKNGSKWIRASRIGTDGNKEVSRGVVEMSQKAEALREKISGTRDDSSESVSETDDGVDAVEQALEELDGLQKDGSDQPTSASGVFAMKFMQDSMARQIMRVDQEMLKFRSELEQSDVSEDPQHRLPASFVHNVNVDGNEGRFRFNGKSDITPSQTLDNSKSNERNTGEPPLTRMGADVSQSNVASSATGIVSNPWLAGRPSTTTSRISRKFNQVVVGKNSDAAEKSLALLKKRQANAGFADTDDARVDISLAATLQKASADMPLQVSSSSGPNEAFKRRNAKVPVAPHSHNSSDQATMVNTIRGHSNAEGQSDADTAEDELHLGDAALHHKQLVARAFAQDSVIEEFARDKAVTIAGESASSINDQALPGWGSWTGAGVDTKYKARPQPTSSTKSVPRRDSGKAHVIISEKRDAKAAKYQVKDIPFPYTSRAQYERSLEAPLGREWNTRLGHQKAVLPRVSAKMGTVIEPLEKLS